ncbi:MAG: YeeE/YedE thiosulfate transporter family protein [Myxococcota bacterium]
MEPIAPFAKVAEWGSVPTIAMAAILGVAFGFVLERAGFGNARTLAGQWYGYNFAVLRVMFTAIVVAMLGLFGLSALGVVDVGRVQLNETFLVPQIVGGLIFGAGFAIGQYCPGTAVVACSTGRLDAMTYFVGFFVGVLAFAFAFPLFAGFYESTNLGRVTVPEGLGIPLGVVVVLVVVMALGAFALTEVLDRKFGNKT